MEKALQSTKKYIPYFIIGPLFKVIEVIFELLTPFLMKYIVDEGFNAGTLDNDYTKKKANSNLVGMTDFILNNKPVMTGWGVLFKQRGIEPNPLVDMIASFMDLRDIHKSQMFQFPKGSEEFEKYKLAQLLDKLDANAILK